MKRIIVVGGGASGMMAAAAAAECGGSVVLLERNEKLGKKLYITGKGRCNLTNGADRETFFTSVVSNSRFLYSSYAAFDNRALIQWMERHGLPLKRERGDRYFPASDKSLDVIRTLKKALERAGAAIRLNCRVKELILNNGECLGVMTEDGETLLADAVIIATGGLSYPSTGSTGDGMNWAEECGHRVIDCVPSLTGMEAELTGGAKISDLAGLTLKNVGVIVRDGKKKLYEGMGEMLFTHTGVSGPLILTASAYTARILPERELLLTIDWKPALDEQTLDRRLQREFSEARNRQVRNAMGPLLPSAAVLPVLAAAKVEPDRLLHDLTKQERAAVLQTLKAFPVRLTAAGDYAGAVITQGGVCVKDVEPSTMRSRKIGRLYFCGEMLDVDALTGGYNLQIAWTTGHAAGLGAMQEEERK